MHRLRTAAAKLADFGFVSLYLVYLLGDSIVDKVRDGLKRKR